MRGKDMLLSANMIRVHDAFGMKETFDIFAKVGIQGIDFNNDVTEYYTDAHDEAYYRELGSYAARSGVAVNKGFVALIFNKLSDLIQHRRSKNLIDSAVCH
jgi:hypothetical protein